MRIQVNPKRQTGVRDIKIYGHFIEHFHRQIYGGIYDPSSKFADEDGFREDVIEAMKKIRVPILRWPGGCFVSSYHWKDAVGSQRTPFFDKAWRVEDPNQFGTDEYIRLCRKIGCEPYICTNAGTGTAEEMSDWVEYCNLEKEGKYASWRIKNGAKEPYHVKYWSIGNENYGFWEIGAKSREEWGRLTAESAKMIKHVDPGTELSAAALTDLDWNINLLRSCGQFLDWISIHEYWDAIHQTNDYATYEQSMAYTRRIDHGIDEVRGLLKAMKLEGKIKIAFDEWNLRGWYHPNAHTVQQGLTKEDYLYPRDKNDDNSAYTMADAVFTACFLSALNRNCDVVGMANFAPIVNTRGCIFTHEDGIVLRSTYHVFDLYVNYLGDVILDTWRQEPAKMEVRNKAGETVTIDALDILATGWSGRDGIALAVINKEPKKEHSIVIDCPAGKRLIVYTVSGKTTESYNDIGRDEVHIEKKEERSYRPGMELTFGPHSVNVVQIF